MKKLLLSALPLAAFFLVLQSCKKEVVRNETIREIKIDTTINATDEFELNLAPLGDDDDVVDIIQQAQHSSVSRVENLTDVFNPVYHYVPGKGASGTDQVILSVSKSTSCKNYNNDSTIVYINFVIH